METACQAAVVLEGRVAAASSPREQDGGSTAGPGTRHHSASCYVMSRNAKLSPTCVTGSPAAPNTSNLQWNLVALERRNTGSQISSSDIGSSAFLLLLNSFYSNSFFIASTKPQTGGEQGCFSSWCISRRFEKPYFSFLLCCR